MDTRFKVDGIDPAKTGLGDERWKFISSSSRVVEGIEAGRIAHELLNPVDEDQRPASQSPPDFRHRGRDTCAFGWPSAGRPLRRAS